MTKSNLEFPVSVALSAKDWAMLTADLLVLEDIDGKDEDRQRWVDTIFHANNEAFFEQAVKKVTGL